MTESRGAMTAQQLTSRIALKHGQGRGLLLSAEEVHELYRSTADLRAQLESAQKAIMTDDMTMAAALHINYCEDLIEDGTPWEVPAEPEPQYFETLLEAVVFLVNLPDALSAHNTAPFTDLMVEFDIPDTDALKHRLEDHKRWSKVVVEQDIALAELRAASKQDELRLREAAERAGVGWFGCDTPDHLAEKVLELRAALETTRNEKAMLLIELQKYHIAERLRSQGAGQWEAGRDAAAGIEGNTCARHCELCRTSPCGKNSAEAIRALKPPAGLASPPKAAGPSSNPADWGKCPKCHQQISKGALLHVCSASSRTEILLSAARVNCEFCRQGREVFKAGDNWEHSYAGSSTQCRSAEIRNLIGGKS